MLFATLGLALLAHLVGLFAYTVLNPKHTASFFSDDQSVYRVQPVSMARVAKPAPQAAAPAPAPTPAMPHQAPRYRTIVAAPTHTSTSPSTHVAQPPRPVRPSHVAPAVVDVPPPPSNNMAGVATDVRGDGGRGAGDESGRGFGERQGGDGAAANFHRLVKRVECRGCHTLPQPGLMAPRPDEFEKVVQSMHWQVNGGQSHRMLVLLSIDDAGIVREAAVKQSSGRTDIDNAALQYIKLFKWIPAYHRSDGKAMASTVELPLEVFF